MRILLIGVYVDDFELIMLNKLSQPQDRPSVAAIKYTKLIYEGFKSILGDNVTNLFLAPMGMFPSCNKFYWFKKTKLGNHYIPFFNFFLIKQLSISLYVLFFTCIWIVRNLFSNEKLFIVFTSLYLPFLSGVLPLKFLRRINIVSFVPDLPEYEFSYSNNNYLPKRLFLNTYVNLSKKLFFLIDYYVFVTEHMKTKFPSKPYMVIEGFVDYSLVNENLEVEKKENAIMYSGALFEKFGIRLLLDAFLDYEINCQLWLFGDGDMVQEIKKRSLNNPNIKYFGHQPNQLIIKYQQMAKLLINPRFSNNEFTKFSFPSKLMEYMVSGTPVLTTKLPGIPIEYKEKMYFINVETVSGFKNSILTCLSIPQKELDIFGKNTKSFVLREKNNFFQIKSLIKDMENYF